MARLTLTNSKHKFNKDIELNKKAGLTDFQVIEDDYFYLAVYKKRITKTENFISFDNGDFVAAIGTIIYEELFGEEALKEIYNKFDYDISRLRSKSIGNYVVCIKKNNFLFCFTDNQNVLNIYYYDNNTEWFITNSLANIAFAIENLKIKEFSLIEEVFQVGGIGKNTIFEHISQLIGSECIEINIKSGKFKINKIKYSNNNSLPKGENVEEISKEYAELLKKDVNILCKFFGDNLAVQNTGGLDSRTVTAALMSVGCVPRIIYGVGNSPLTGTQQEDLKFNKIIENRYNLNFYQMNWNTDLINDIKNWKNLFEKYGFGYSKYGGGINYFSEYEGKIPNYPKLITTGLYGEFLRLRDWALEYCQNYETEYINLDDIVNNYFMKRSSLSNKTYNNFYGYREYYYNILIEYSKEYGINIENEKVYIGDFDRLRSLRAKEGDSLLVNQLNEFTHAVNIFSLSETVYDYPFRVNYEFRKNAKFQLNVIKNLYPNLLKLPLFSHCKKTNITKDLEAQVKKDSNHEISYIKKIKEFFKEKGPTVFYRFKKLRIFIAPTDQEKIRILMSKMIYRDLKKYNYIKPKPDKMGDERRLAMYTQYLYGVKWIMKKRCKYESRKS